MGKRNDNLDTHVTNVLAELAGDCNDAGLVPQHGCREYQWWEIRESIVRCLFQLDHEQTFGEIHAKWVTESCL